MKRVAGPLLSAILFVFLQAPVFSQAGQSAGDETQVLFKFGETPVNLSEFEYVYRKNNMNDENAFSEKSLKEYLDLYINFRLKVKEAEALGLDTLESIKNELAGYRDQLAKSYLQDRQVTDKLLQEAYERMKQEVRAAHILFEITGAGLPADTLKAYNQALEVRRRIIKGEDFEKLARQFSTDPSVKDNGGDIGYFTVLQTVYPFESAAYETKVGEISLPVRTRFGYHLVKVLDKRQAQGTIRVAHILVQIPDNATQQQIEEAKKKAQDLHQQLKSGGDFEELARRHSEDKLSAGKGGVLPEFGTGKMVMEFEKAAFALQNPGDISQPVQTDYGWHIIKLISKPGIAPFDEAKVDLKRKIERDTRSALATHVLVDRIKKENNFKEISKNKDALYKRIQADLTKPKISVENKKGLDKTLFTLAGKNYTQSDYVEYLESQPARQREEAAYKIFTTLYESYVEDVLLKYQDSMLEQKYPEFKALMQEYRDGTLLFALTDQKVWSKALQDTAGLKAFHEENKSKYMWDTRLKAAIYTAKDEKAAKAARKLAAKGKLDMKGVAEKVNAKDSTLLSAHGGVFEKGQNPVVDSVAWEKGISENINNADGTITFVHVQEVVPPTPKTLDEARGFIVSDYQEYLEKQWIQDLRQKYPVTVNSEVLKSIVKNN